METVANQQVVKTCKEPSNKNNLYGIFNLDALQTAMIYLSGSALKLWCFINKNQAGYEFALSQVEATKWGVKSYDRAKKELMEKGYLIQTSSNHYEFHEKPIAKVDYITKIEE